VVNGLCKFIVFVEIIVGAVGLGFLLGRRSQRQLEPQRLRRRRVNVQTRYSQPLAIGESYPEVLPVRRQIKQRHVS